ncbi:MAG: site-specific DNA-methyltransferase [Anaerolineaceae bacterium]|nr:site-specific DNA-methyltransferase [Anaerolineaceae bacterium]
MSSTARAPLELNQALPSTEPATTNQNGSVFSLTRDLVSAEFELGSGLKFDTRLKMDGLDFLSRLPKGEIPVAFLDPQYRDLLDKMSYGNEGKTRGRARSNLQQMDANTITKFIRAINIVLAESGHLFLWMDKFQLCTGFRDWLTGTRLDVVDMITWDKGRMGMGYRTRRQSEYLIVLQKQPRRAKGVWKIHNIRDVWPERVERGIHVHRKPVDLQARLIEAVSNPGDIVIDPAAGSFSVLEACQQQGRKFLGCDIEG